MFAFGAVTRSQYRFITINFTTPASLPSIPAVTSPETGTINLQLTACTGDTAPGNGGRRRAWAAYDRNRRAKMDQQLP